MQAIRHFFKHLFFTRRLYVALGALSALFFVSYLLGWLYWPAVILTVFVLCSFLLDLWILFARHEPVSAQRLLSDRFSNGDDNAVAIELQHQYPFTISLRIIDELPVQFQRRDFVLKTLMTPGAQKTLRYEVRPVTRGEYIFHDINIFICSPLKLACRRQVVPAEQVVSVMPAFSQLRKYALLAAETELAEAGNKRKPKTGHSLEFEQLREYVVGDDVRNINWKATARKGGQLMLNSFADERSQQIYCVIDKSRAMKMPFDGMTLLEYAINASLLLSQVALLRHDKAGIICFDDKETQLLAAEKRNRQMNRIIDMLYNQQTGFMDSDFEKLQLTIHSQIHQRSLLVLFTNFESGPALDRQLPFIRQLARQHLVLVVFFENTGLNELAGPGVDNMEDLYIKTIAEKFMQEKKRVLKELQRYGIAGLLTTPKQVTIHTINKYLELKSRQMI